MGGTWVGTSNPASLAGTHPAPPPMCETGKSGYVTRLRGCGRLVVIFLMFLLMLQLLYSQITSRHSSDTSAVSSTALQSCGSLVVLCAHARGSAASVRVSAGAAGREGCGYASKWAELAVPALLRPDGEACHALFALKEHCRHVVVLVALLLLVRDVVLSVRPDVRA
jgi:hypothetical protein